MSSRTKILGIFTAFLLMVGSSCKLEGLKAPLGQQDAENAEFKAEVLAQISVYRRQTIICGGSVMPAAREVKEQANLTTAALQHSADMNQRRYLSQKSPPPNSKTLISRVTDTGLTPCSIAGNIARIDRAKPLDVVSDWMKNRESCLNIMSDSFDSIGFGSSGSYYTMTLAKVQGDCK